MRYSVAATALLGAVTNVAAQSGCTDDGGNWYCQAVKAITYTGVGGDGSYNKVTNMDSTSGGCSGSPYGYSGTLSPMDEEVSMHFRGPLNLKQFAVYMPGSSSSKSKARRNEHRRRHAHAAHGHAHAHAAAHEARHADEKRAVGDMVTATIDGQVVTWVNTYDGATSAADSSVPAATTAAAAAAAAAPSANTGFGQAKAVNYGGSGSWGSGGHSGSGSGGHSGSSSGSSTGSWGRSAYYNADDGTSNGLTFLNHFGGTAGSGVWDDKFGNSLSYSSTDGTTGSSSAQTLSDTTLPSSAEVIIMTDQECNGDCGYVRPGTVAYHGFDGPNKAFFYEFSMPDSGETSTNPWDPINMSAIWMLNAQIPNTLQYAQDETCSCWSSGCGEFDIFEVLSPGSDKCKSTMHGNKAGGDSNYFQRPTQGTMKAVVVMYNNNIHIKVLDSDYQFPESMDEGTIAGLAAETSQANKFVSLFALANAASG